MATNFDDVRAFHAKFGIGPVVSRPHLPTRDVWEFRHRFLRQEFQEIVDAYEAGDLPAFFDGLLDLVYVVMGTADLASLPWQAGWDEVQRANMTKARALDAEQSFALTGRGHALDVIKPPGWVPPDIAGILEDTAK